MSSIHWPFVRTKRQRFVTVQVHIADAGHETVTQRVQTNKQNVLGLTRIISTQDVAPVGPDGRVRDTFEVTLAKAEHEAAHRNERILLAEQEAQSVRSFAVKKFIIFIFTIFFGISVKNLDFK